MSIEPLSQSMEFAVLPKLGPTQNKYVWEEHVGFPYSHKLTWCDSILSRTSWGCNDFHSNSTAVCDNRQSLNHSAVWEPDPPGIALFQETIQIFECMNPLRTIPSTWFHITVSLQVPGAAWVRIISKQFFMLLCRFILKAHFCLFFGCLWSSCGFDFEKWLFEYLVLFDIIWPDCENWIDILKHKGAE